MLYNNSLYSLIYVFYRIKPGTLAKAAEPAPRAAPERAAVAAFPPGAFGALVMPPILGFYGQPAYEPGSH